MKLWKLEIKWVREQTTSIEQTFSEDYIFHEWKTKFLDKNECDSLFYRIFEERYKRLLGDTIKHQEMNFSGKALYRYVLYAFVVVQVILLYFAVHIALENTIENIIDIATFSEAMLLAITLTMLYSIAKNLDVQKHQETWARTRQSLHECRTEMVRYVEKLTPYTNYDADIRFQKRVLEILDRNRAKFTQNLEEKEKGLLDELTILKR